MCLIDTLILNILSSECFNKNMLVNNSMDVKLVGKSVRHNHVVFLIHQEFFFYASVKKVVARQEQ